MKKHVEINMQPSHILAYRFVEKYIKKNIVSPEAKEIADKISLTSRHVYRLIDDLVALGYFTKVSHKKRSIKIIKQL